MGADGFMLSNRIPAGGPIVAAILGASNARGNNAETGNPALYADAYQPGGYVMPAGAVLYEDGTTPLTTYPTTHFGPEVGLIDYLVAAGISANRITVIKHGVPGSALSTWITTYCAELLGYYPTAGYPNAALLWEGAADATSEAQSLLVDSNSADVLGRLRRDRGAGLPVTIAHLNPDLPLAGYPYRENVRAGQASFVARCQGTRLLDLSGLPKSVDLEHFTAEAQIAVGRIWAAQLFEHSVLTT